MTTELTQYGGIILTEVKLARVWKHLTDPDTAVAIITAFRDEAGGYEANVKRNETLINAVRGGGFGYSIVDGTWIENQGKPDEVEVKEDSLFITAKAGKEKALFELMKAMAKKYNQESFIFKPGGKDAEYQIVSPSGKVVDKYKKVSMNKIEEFMTKLRPNKRGSSFKFKSVRTGANRSARMVYKISNGSSRCRAATG